MKSSVARTIIIVGAVTLVAGYLRFSHLTRPQEKVFDEVYYASDGCWYAGYDYRECGLEADAEVAWVHPPLGKQLIAGGIGIFGNRALGWRAAPAAAGTVTVALTGALAFLLFGSPVLAGVGALFLATESLHFVQSRIAMVDVFLTMFVVLGFLLLVADRRRREAQAGHRAPPRLRPLQLAAGAAFGAAVATKWSGVLALLGAAGLATGWAWSRHRAAGTQRRWRSLVRLDGPGLALSFALVPIVVYLVTYIPWLAARGFDFGQLIENQRYVAEFHFGLPSETETGEPYHPYMSSAWTWLFMTRPVAYFWKGTDFTGAEIISLGNPVLFWGAIIMIPLLAIVWQKKNDWVAGAVLVPILAQYVPWLLVPRPLFLFYMTPVTPFLALGATYLLRDLSSIKVQDRPVGIPAAGLIVLASMLMFFFFLPVLSADPISLDSWNARIWFDGWI